MANESKTLAELESENARLRQQLSAAREREFHNRNAIHSLLTNGQLLDIEDVRAKVAEGGPHVQHWIELEREMAEEMQVYREMMANRVPLRPVLEHAEELLRREGGNGR